MNDDDLLLNFLDEADKRPDALDPTPGMFGNLPGAAALGAARGVTRTAFLARAGSAVIGDALRGGTEAQDAVFADMEDSLDALTPDPVTTGSASHVIGGLGEILVPLVASRNPAVAAASTTAVAASGPTVDLIRQGVDAKTAAAVGGIFGAANLVGLRIPFFGNSLATRMASGVAGNVAVDVPAEFGAAGLLEGQGFDEQAGAFGPTLESAALASLLGAAFGGFSHAHRRMTAPERDALLVANNIEHFATAGMPGTPNDAGAMVAHEQAMATAVRQVLNGEPVSVTVPEGFRLHPELRVQGYGDVLVALESAGNPKAKARTSSATGLHQFTESTWLGTIEQAKPSWAQGMTDQQLLAMRTDPDKSRQMELHLRGENADALEAAGQPVTTWNLYAAHHFGPKAAIAFAKAADDAPLAGILSPGQIKANPYLKGKTKGEAIANWQARARKAGVPVEGQAIPRTPLEATEVIDTRITELEQRAQGEVPPDRFKELMAEDADLVALLREQEAAPDALPADPRKRLTPEEREQIDTRRVEIRTELEQGRSARAFAQQLNDLRGKLDKIDNDADLVALADRLAPDPLRAPRLDEPARTTDVTQRSTTDASTPETPQPAPAGRAEARQPAPEAAAAQAGRTEARPETDAVAPDVRAAQDMVAARPDLQVIDDVGVARPAAEFLAEDVETPVLLRALDAAAACFLRTAA